MPSRNGAGPELPLGGHSTQLPLLLAADELAAPAAAPVLPALLWPRPALPPPRPPPEPLDPPVTVLALAPAAEFVVAALAPVVVVVVGVLLVATVAVVVLKMPVVVVLGVVADVPSDGSAKAPPFAG